ncbi:MAG TPA: hypothetical protein VGJ33_06325 [Candidatus Angelobacter sp.]|jgi:hypothetical protein
MTESDILKEAASAQLSKELSELSKISSASRQRAKQAWVLYLVWSAAALVLLGTVAIVVEKQFRDIKAKLASSSSHMAELEQRLSSAQTTLNDLSTQLQKEQARLNNLQQTRLVFLQNDVKALKQNKVNSDEFARRLADLATTESLRSLEAEVHNKADEKVLDDLKNEVAKRATQQDIKSLSELIQNKADGTDLTNVKTEVKNLQSAVSGKAEKGDLQTDEGTLKSLGIRIEKIASELATVKTSMSSSQGSPGQNQSAPNK